MYILFHWILWGFNKTIHTTLVSNHAICTTSVIWVIRPQHVGQATGTQRKLLEFIKVFKAYLFLLQVLGLLQFLPILQWRAMWTAWMTARFSPGPDAVVVNVAKNTCSRHAWFLCCQSVVNYSDPSLRCTDYFKKIVNVALKKTLCFCHIDREYAFI